MKNIVPHALLAALYLSIARFERNPGAPPYLDPGFKESDFYHIYDMDGRLLTWPDRYPNFSSHLNIPVCRQLILGHDYPEGYAGDTPLNNAKKRDHSVKQYEEFKAAWELAVVLTRKRDKPIDYESAFVLYGLFMRHFNALAHPLDLDANSVVFIDVADGNTKAIKKIYDLNLVRKSSHYSAQLENSFRNHAVNTSFDRLIRPWGNMVNYPSLNSLDRVEAREIIEDHLAEFCTAGYEEEVVTFRHELDLISNPVYFREKYPRIPEYVTFPIQPTPTLDQVYSMLGLNRVLA